MPPKRPRQGETRGKAGTAGRVERCGAGNKKGPTSGAPGLKIGANADLLLFLLSGSLLRRSLLLGNGLLFCSLLRSGHGNLPTSNYGQCCLRPSRAVTRPRPIVAKLEKKHKI